jgi:hypothetical protein
MNRKNGIIGCGFFKDLQIVLDHKRQRIFVATTETAFNQVGYDVNSWPLLTHTKTDEGFVVNAELDGKLFRLMLDTGSSHTVIRSSILNPTDLHETPKLLPIKYFKVADKDSIAFDIVSFNFEQPDTVDGFLGIDFLAQQVLFIDFKNNIIRIQ